MENGKRHEFMEDIRRLFQEKKLHGEGMYFYYRNSDALRQPHRVILSAQSLPQYWPLTDSCILRNLVEGI
jgi:hypothetical protein